jgi:hypothetical protein
MYGEGEKASAAILQEDGSRTIVASIHAHGTAKNLQTFSRMLFTTPPASNKTWEQSLGRCHRFGQSSAVVADVYVHTPEFRKSFQTARSRASFVENTTGSSQKLSYAVHALTPGES